MNDADLEMAELTRLGNRSSALRRRGICTHGWSSPVVIGKPETKCNHCGQVFESFEALHAEGSRRLHGDDE